MEALASSWEGTPSSWVNGTDPCGAASCGYSSALPRCEWGGVSCDGWRVIGLSLVPMGASGSQLRGSLPTALASLSALQQLNLRGNALTGAIPPGLGSLPSLTLMDLSGNGLGSTLPAALGGSPSLMALACMGCGLQGSLPPEYGALARLTMVDLSGNVLGGGLPAAWSTLGALRAADLSGNRLHGPLPASWGSLTALQSLRVADNALSGVLPPSWARLPRLALLDLRDNCALCGPLPVFAANVTGSVTTQVLYAGTSLGWQCAEANCSSAPLSLGLLGQVVTGVAVVLVLASLCVWRRATLFRRERQAQGRPVSRTLVLRDVFSLRRAPPLPPIPNIHGELGMRTSTDM